MLSHFARQSLQFIADWKWDHSTKAQTLNKKEINFAKREGWGVRGGKKVLSNCEILL